MLQFDAFAGSLRGGRGSALSGALGRGRGGLRGATNSTVLGRLADDGGSGGGSGTTATAEISYNPRAQGLYDPRDPRDRPRQRIRSTGEAAGLGSAGGWKQQHASARPVDMPEWMDDDDPSAGLGEEQEKERADGAEEQTQSGSFDEDGMFRLRDAPAGPMLSASDGATRASDATPAAVHKSESANALTSMAGPMGADGKGKQLIEMLAANDIANAAMEQSQQQQQQPPRTQPQPQQHDENYDYVKSMIESVVEVKHWCLFIYLNKGLWYLFEDEPSKNSSVNQGQSQRRRPALMQQQSAPMGANQEQNNASVMAAILSQAARPPTTQQPPPNLNAFMQQQQHVAGNGFGRVASQPNVQQALTQQPQQQQQMPVQLKSNARWLYRDPKRRIQGKAFSIFSEKLLRSILQSTSSTFTSF